MKKRHKQSLKYLLLSLVFSALDAWLDVDGYTMLSFSVGIISLICFGMAIFIQAHYEGQVRMKNRVLVKLDILNDKTDGVPQEVSDTIEAIDVNE